MITARLGMGGCVALLLAALAALASWAGEPVPPGRAETMTAEYIRNRQVEKIICEHPSQSLSGLFFLFGLSPAEKVRHSADFRSGSDPVRSDVTSSPPCFDL